MTESCNLTLIIELYFIGETYMLVGYMPDVESILINIQFFTK